MYDSKGPDHDHSHAQNRFAVIPTAEKLDSDPRFFGRGVRIAFLDSGFYPHPDFIDRVMGFHDVSGEERTMGSITTAAAHHWHGTQTVAACAGDGCLSGGVYRGIACGAELVLVKASRQGRVGDAEIEEGLRWILANRARYEIRILNISLGGDRDQPSSESSINSLIAEIIACGTVVTVAAGNSAERRSAPPASAPQAITIGGYSDENQLDASKFDLYNSSFGPTADGLVKPELIAPAMNIAAPILPGTDDYETAEFLSMLTSTPDFAFHSMLSEFWQAARLTVDILNADIDSARRIVEYALHRRKIVATHYQHVDGTSFAAPITASIAAQMLEANRSLTPATLKNILISTASRLGGHPALRQGFGVLNARLAVELAAGEKHALDKHEYLQPRITNNRIQFSFHGDRFDSVHLAGDFNDWDPVANRLVKCEDGIWRTSIACLPAGRYRYKFLIDDRRWTEDPSHLLKEQDGFGGFNSLLLID